MTKWLLIGAALLCAAVSAPCRASPPPSGSTFESEGLVLHYHVSGHGSPVVVLAGGPGFGAGYMQPVVDMVAKDHTVMLLEQRGTGRSLPAAETPATINEDLVISDLEALRRKLGYESWTVLGHSFGTFTALRYAIAHPSRVRALALLAVVPPRTADDTMEANLQRRLPASTGPAFHVLAVKMKEAKSDAERNELAGRMDDLLAPAYLYDQAKAPMLEALSAAAGVNAQTSHLILQSVGSYDLVAGLNTLRMPVLIVQGSADPLDPTVAAKTQAAIPGAQLTVLERCGHFAWIEAPDRLASRLAAFLADK